MEDKKPLVSVILPTYNEKENIRSMINELQKRIPKPLEIIIVDDDSPDMTWKEVLIMKNKNPKDVIIKTEEPKNNNKNISVIFKAILLGILFTSSVIFIKIKFFNRPVA